MSTIDPGICLFTLPSEIVENILSYLPPIDLLVLSETCRALYSRARDDRLWRRLVQENIPGVQLDTPHPSPSYWALYKSQFPYWFLTKCKIWFPNIRPFGPLVVARYDPRRGCIEANVLVVINEARNDSLELYDGPGHTVSVHPFRPKISLHLDTSAFQLDHDAHKGWQWLPYRKITTRNRIELVKAMNCPDLVATLDPSAQVVHPSSFNPDESTVGCAVSHFEMTWQAIKRGKLSATTPVLVSNSLSAASSHRPMWLSEASDRVFSIVIQPFPIGSPLGVRTRSMQIVHATIDTALWTPSPTKPWRGIWVGDYFDYGCEFLLVHQEWTAGDEAEYRVEQEKARVRLVDEADDEFERSRRRLVCRGMLRAIKLTGEPRMNEGEISFRADHLEHATLRSAYGPWENVIVTNGKGHFAHDGFQPEPGGMALTAWWEDVQIILISNDRMAVSWGGSNNVTSIFERVNIDQFLAPSSGGLEGVVQYNMDMQTGK